MKNKMQQMQEQMKGNQHTTNTQPKNYSSSTSQTANAKPKASSSDYIEFEEVK